MPEGAHYKTNNKPLPLPSLSVLLPISPVPYMKKTVRQVSANGPNLSLLSHKQIVMACVSGHAGEFAYQSIYLVKVHLHCCQNILVFVFLVAVLVISYNYNLYHSTHASICKNDDWYWLITSSFLYPTKVVYKNHPSFNPLVPIRSPWWDFFWLRFGFAYYFSKGARTQTTGRQWLGGSEV